MTIKRRSLSKLGILTLSATMIAGGILPSVGHAQVENQAETINTENEIVGNLMAKSLEIEKYIYQDSNGNLRLNSGVSRVLNVLEVQTLQNSINQLNQAKDSGEISFTADRSIEINQSLNSATARGLSLTSYSFSMTKAKADSLVKTLKASSDVWTVTSILLAGVSGAVPNPGTIAAAAAAGLMAFGTTKVANLVSSNTSSKGCTVKIQWLPIPKVTASKR